MCSYYDEFWDQFIGLNSPGGKTIIEIGGYPGRYLAYLSSKYGLIPTCLDYNSNSSQIEKSFKVMGVKNFSIIQEDFTAYQPKQDYNYVLSNGFVEHFEDFNSILDLHTKYLKPDGKLCILIPNMKGYIKLYKQLVDSENLKIHNLNSMSLGVFKNFADRHELKISKLTYFGGFPYTVHQPLNLFQKVIFKVHWYLFRKWLNKILIKNPSPSFSSSIIAIFEKDQTICADS